MLLEVLHQHLEAVSRDQLLRRRVLLVDVREQLVAHAVRRLGRGRRQKVREGERAVEERDHRGQ